MNKIKKYWSAAAALVCALSMVVLEYAPFEFSDNRILSEIWQMIITRALGSVAFLILLRRLGYRILGSDSCAGLAALIPAVLVAINNFPIIALASGEASVTAGPVAICLFAIQCLLVGLFEETVFRGCVFAVILEKNRNSTRGIFISTLLSSLLFGGIHIFNLFVGAGVGSVVLQMGYSFLIGGMCAAVLLRTRNIWLCALIHAIYNFGGYLLPTLGAGSAWNVPTIAITAVLGIAVLIHTVYLLLHTKPQDIQGIFATSK